MMRLFDCFTFFNELDLLELRLTELDPVVHRFVLVEGAYTFTGLPKPLTFKENRERFARFLPKIIYVELGAFEPNLTSAWDREYASRRAIMRGLSNAGPDDLILISDVDEIPKPAILAASLPQAPRRLTVFESEGFMYYLDASCPYNSVVQSPRLIARRYLRDPQAVRALKPHVSKNPIWRPITEALSPIIRPLRSWAALGYPLPIHIERRAAWHFTNMGGAEAIRDKLLAYSHTEMATPTNTNIPDIKKMLADGRSIFGGTAVLSEARMSDLPESVQRHPERWAHLLSPKKGR